MKNKLKKQEKSKLPEQSSSSEQQQQSQHIEDISLKPRILKKDSLFVSFAGTIQSGYFDDSKSLKLYYSFVTGPDWKCLNKERFGVTQMGSRDNQRIVWNMPFEMTYETTFLGGWPQLIVIVYDTDFFGKTFVKGYGNVHLPTSGGIQHRKIRIFCPEPRSIISGILGYFQGCIAEYRDAEKVLALGDGREVTRTHSVGHIEIKVETSKYNFNKFGYE